MFHFCHDGVKTNINLYKRRKRSKWKRKTRTRISSSSKTFEEVSSSSFTGQRLYTNLSTCNQIIQSTSTSLNDSSTSNCQKLQEETQTEESSLRLNERHFDRLEEVPFEIIEAEDILFWGCPPLKVKRMAFDEDQDLFSLVVDKAASVPMYRKCKQFLASVSTSDSFQHWDKFFNENFSVDGSPKKLILSWCDFNPFVFELNDCTISESLYCTDNHFDNNFYEESEEDDDKKSCKVFDVPSGDEKAVIVLQSFENRPFVASSHEDYYHSKQDFRRSNPSNYFKISQLSNLNNNIKNNKSPVETQILYQGQSISISANATDFSSLPPKNSQEEYIVQEINSEDDDFQEKDDHESLESNDSNNNYVRMDKVEQYFKIFNSLPTFYTTVYNIHTENTENSLNRRRASVEIAQQEWEQDQLTDTDHEISSKKHNFEVLEVFKMKRRDECSRVWNYSSTEAECHQDEKSLTKDSQNGSLLSFSPKDSFLTSYEGSQPNMLNIMEENFAQSGVDTICDDIEDWIYDVQGSDSMDGENFMSQKFYPPPTPLGSRKGDSLLSSSKHKKSSPLLLSSEKSSSNIISKKPSSLMKLKKELIVMPSSPKCTKSILKYSKHHSETKHQSSLEKTLKDNNNSDESSVPIKDGSIKRSHLVSKENLDRSSSSTQHHVKVNKSIKNKLIFKTRQNNQETTSMSYSDSGKSKPSDGWSCSVYDKEMRIPKTILRSKSSDDDYRKRRNRKPRTRRWTSSSSSLDNFRKSKNTRNKPKLLRKCAQECNISKKYNVTRASLSSASSSCSQYSKPHQKQRARRKPKLSLWQKMKRYFFGCKTENKPPFSKSENNQKRSTSLFERIICWWRRASHRVVVRQDSLQLIRIKRQRLLRDLHEFSQDVKAVCKNPRVTDRQKSGKSSPQRFETPSQAKIVSSEGCIQLRDQRVLLDVENGNRPKEKRSSKPLKGILKNSASYKSYKSKHLHN